MFHLASLPSVDSNELERAPVPVVEPDRRAMTGIRARLIAWTARCLCAAALSLAGAAPFPLHAQPSTAAASSAYSETDIKAAFLYNFGSYVQWPTEAGPSDPITFAVLNARGVELALTRLVQGRTLQNRPVRVRRLRSIGELDGEEVVFIGAAENWRLPELVASIEGPTLIVTDAPDGLDAGAMINFQLIDERVRFEVRLPAADAAGLMLSARLLSAALRVEISDCWLECQADIESLPLLSRAPGSVRARLRVRSANRS
jgi:hypothetical protein